MDVIAAHADWSVDPAKRWVALAVRTADRRWGAFAPRPVGDPTTLVAALRAASGPRAALALGLDLPLGVPRGWVRAAARPEPDFPAFLRGLPDEAPFWRVAAALDEVSPERPFYPARAERGLTRAAHAAALGLGGPGDLLRACDRATAERPAGAPPFWTLGANQTGKAAISAWRGWLAPALRAGAPLDPWPFAGAVFRALLAPGRAALAEVYPAEAMRHAGVRPSGSKRDREARRAVVPALRDAMARLGVDPDAALSAVVADGFGRDAAGEDRFDCVLGLLGLVGVLDGARDDGAPDDPWLRRWEGWVLGQTAQPRPARTGPDTVAAAAPP